MKKGFYIKKWHQWCWLLVLPFTVQADIITTVAGTGSQGYTDSVISATNAKLDTPKGVAVDSSGNLYIADSGNFRVRKVDKITGNISKVAGLGSGGYNGDNISAINALVGPSDVAVDSSGNVYIADISNHRIRKVSSATGFITTVAGNGVQGSSNNESALEGNLSNPRGIALASNGDLYIADTSNHRIRKVNLSATNPSITTVAGNGTRGFSGDGISPTAVALNSPADIVIDSSNNLYIADQGNHRIRKVSSTTGIITTIAGIGTAGSSGDNGSATAAKLYFPQDIALDSSGNLYIADSSNHRIRKVTLSATLPIITTVVGSSPGFSGDEGSPLTAQLQNPTRITIDSSDNLYIADTDNHRIRKVTRTEISSVTFPANQWRFVGLPLNPVGASNSTVQAIFGDDLGIENYATTWKVHGRTSPTSGTYSELSSSAILDPTAGYWVLSLAGGTVDMEGAPKTQVNNKVEANLPKAAAALSPNVPVVYPFTSSQPWTNVTQISMKNGEVGVDEVIATRSDPPSTVTGFLHNGSSYAAGNIWTYNGTAYVAGKPTLNPWDAFWVYVRAPGLAQLNADGSMKVLIPKP